MIIPTRRLMAPPEIARLIQQLSKLPGLGPRSSRRVALYLLKRRTAVLDPLVAALTQAAERVRPCANCGNLDAGDPCGLCRDERRDGAL